jgi:hypothetical protein
MGACAPLAKIRGGGGGASAWGGRGGPVGVEDEVVMNCADALAATAADMLAEDFTDFLFPDAPGTDHPRA